MRRPSSIALLALVVLSSLVGATTTSGKAWWPQFRGPNASGLGEGKPPVTFGPDQNVRWKTAVGPGLSSPIVWEGRIFLTEFDRANNRLATLGIDRRTGKILWRQTVVPERIEKVHEISSPAGATPATDGERVYVYFGSYGFVVYDLDGNQKWERRLPVPGEPVWRGRLAHRRRRVAGGQPSREGRLSAGRQSSRRHDSVEDRPLVVSVWVVDSRALASRWNRRDCRAWRRLQAGPASDGLQPRGWSGAMVGRRTAALRKEHACHWRRPGVLRGAGHHMETSG